MTDEQLIGALRTGQKDSLAVLIDRWERPLFRFVYRMMPRAEDAQDICQETFLRVYDKAGRFDPSSRFSTWMYQIALNLCRDQMRKKKRWGALVLPAAHRADDDENAALNRFAGDEDPAEDVERTEKVALVRQAMLDLPGDQREVLVMKEYEGMKFKEIAAIVGCSESTVKSRMYYGLRNLRRALADRGWSEENVS